MKRTFHVVGAAVALGAIFGAPWCPRANPEGAGAGPALPGATVLRQNTQLCCFPAGQRHLALPKHLGEHPEPRPERLLHPCVSLSHSAGGERQAGHGDNKRTRRWEGRGTDGSGLEGQTCALCRLEAPVQRGSTCSHTARCRRHRDPRWPQDAGTQGRTDTGTQGHRDAGAWPRQPPPRRRDGKHTSLLHLPLNKKSSKCLINSLGRNKNIMRKTIWLKKKMALADSLLLAVPGHMCLVKWSSGLWLMGFSHVSILHLCMS